MGTFQLIRCDERSRARVGILTTPHNQIPTPVFMPVGTQGTVKGLAPDRLKGMGVTVLLGNSYHLHLRPGEQLIREAGGLHRFMSWDGSILTDCGGFQVFSLSKLVRIEEEGVTFRSHLDGSLHRFTPEVSMQIQNDIGSDIVMALDQCVGYPTSEFQQKSAMLRTLSWAKRCRDFFHSKEQQLFGIVQGGMIPEFRQYSAEKTVEIGFDGFAIGGLSVGEPKPMMYEMIDATVPFLPENQPRYLMGVGAPESIIEGVRRGIDMFDCVLPTRNARNACLFTENGKMNIDTAQYAHDFRPPDPNCGCMTCRSFTRAYLRHLFKAGEILAAELATIHNVFFMIDLMNHLRSAILNGYFDDFSQEFMARYQGKVGKSPLS